MHVCILASIDIVPTFKHTILLNKINLQYIQKHIFQGVCTSGPSCSKLTTSLVNISNVNNEIRQCFFVEKM